ncbi:MAG TPA: methyltransferase [Vicinamibacterales bacterium]|nr:methyltransferase [Vicinamibacterales bacterium]
MAKHPPKRTSAPSPYEVLFQMVIGKWISQAIGTVVEIGVPDGLRNGARRCSDIAREAGVSEDGLYRLLRALASVGLFAESANRRFKLTPMGQFLRSDHPQSAAGYAQFVAHDSTWRPWGQLNYSVKTGMPAFDHVFGAPIFEYLSKNPKAAAVFDDAMTSISATEAHATSDAYDFKGIKTLMDVAGGHGLLLATVLRRHKTMRGVLFDLPHVVAGAAATFARAGITGRVRTESGDFFKELPSGADAIIMKHIVHDWDDDSATRILQTCHRALGPRGRVLIVDPVVPPGNVPHYGKLLDLEMLVLTPRGRERTKTEFARLLRGAGFRLSRVIATKSPLSVVEAVKA